MTPTHPTIKRGLTAQTILQIGSTMIDQTIGGNVTKSKAPVDKNGFTMKPPITDTQCILMCLKNAPCGADKKQVQKLIEYYSCD